MAVTVNTIVFWDVTPEVSQIGINVSEERAASIFSIDTLKMEAQNNQTIWYHIPDHFNSLHLSQLMYS